jgi:tetratricopeptide (TPR) repeat protein
MPGVILDVEQHMLLLEIEPPFCKRDVQLARRRMAKRWHPDIAPAGRQFEHERHLKAINEAADQLERLAESSRGGRVSRNAVKVSAAAARAAREEAGRRAYEAEQREREAAADRAKNDPFGSRVPDHSVVHRYARCSSYPEWGVGTVEGIYFTGDADSERDVQQWARVKFSHGVRTVPAGSMQFVDFSKPDPASERVERFMTAAQRAMAEGDHALAAQRLVYARDAEPKNVGVLRLMTLAFWQAGNLDAAARSVRDWARADDDRPAAHRFAARIYEDMGAIDLAAEAAARAAERGPSDAGAWERLGRLRLQLCDREGSLQAFEQALGLGANGQVHELVELALALEPRVRQTV